MKKSSVLKTCEVCGSQFSAQKYRADEARFCSRKCFYKHGSGVAPRTEIEKRSKFLTGFDTPVGKCWEWKLHRDANGYGITVRVNGSRLAHRAALYFKLGKLPKDQCVLHRCDNPPCVNPDHLFIGSHLDNMLDMKSKNRNEKGQRRYNAKLKDSDIPKIREDGRSHSKIAATFGVTRTIITNIKNRKSWQHVP